MLHFRLICQGLFLFFFIFLVFITRAAPPLHSALVLQSFLQTDPLIAVTTLILTHSFSLFFLPAIILVIMTLVFGRLFCGWICPLGTTLDIFDKLCIPKRRKRHKTGLSHIKYLILSTIIILSLIGISVGTWLSPLCLVTHIYGALLIPAVQLLISLLLGLLERIISPANILSLKSSLIETGLLPPPEFDTPITQSALFMTLVLVALLSTLFVQRRFWCRNLCPLGALLAILSRMRLARITIGDSCKDCGLCVRKCRMGAYPIASSNPHGQHPHFAGSRPLDAECIQCQTCISSCPSRCIRPTWISKSGKPLQVGPTLPSRRAFLSTSLVAAATAVSFKLHSVHVHPQDRPLRPPGASPDDDYFLARCQRCGECINACPTNALQFSFLEAGILGFGAPIFSPDIGYCLDSCTRCGQVCPSKAIPHLSLSSKRLQRIGIAFIDRSKCLPWTTDQECFTCEEVCPIKAIFLTPARKISNGSRGEPTNVVPDETKIRRPLVDKSRCNGCGFCQWKCKREVTDAIRIYRLPRDLIFFGYGG